MSFERTVTFSTRFLLLAFATLFAGYTTRVNADDLDLNVIGAISLEPNPHALNPLCFDVVTHGDLAYAAVANSRSSGFVAIDISDLSTPEIVGSSDVRSCSMQIEISRRRRREFMA